MPDLARAEAGCRLKGSLVTEARPAWQEGLLKMNDTYRKKYQFLIKRPIKSRSLSL